MFRMDMIKPNKMSHKDSFTVYFIQAFVWDIMQTRNPDILQITLKIVLHLNSHLEDGYPCLLWDRLQNQLLFVAQHNCHVQLRW